MTATVQRIYPESRTGLINWIEKHFHDIDQYIVTFAMKDGTTVTVYDAYSFFNAMGLCGIQTHVIQRLNEDGEFIAKKK
ncbi:MAG: hypothetical protein K6T78_15815 [Alicyclobacillus sp.]|nr:hypothetical protein [Alicyclobacillus sp.]